MLAGKAAVKGQGNVAKAEVKADGVVFEKKPGSYSVEPEVVVPPVFPSDGGGGGYIPPSPPPTVAVTGVSLPAMQETTVGVNATLTATVTPSNATNKAVTYSSDNSTVVEVTAAGAVTANSIGTAVITVTTVDGGWTDKSQVTVRPLLILLARQRLAGTNDNYLYLKLVGDNLDSNTQYIFDAGTTGLSLGTATENATNGCTIALTGVAKPGTLTLRATNLACGTDSNMLTMEIPEPTASLVSTGVEATTANFSFTAQSGASAVTMQQKLASAGDNAWAPAQLVAPLNAQATAATVTGLTSGESYDFRLLVVDGTTPGASNVVHLTTRVPVTAVTLSQTDPLQLKFGETVTLTATVAPANATDQTVSWISSNPAVLRSDGSGKFTAIGAGNASIGVGTAQAGVPLDTCEVNVTVPTPIRAEAITAVAEPFAGRTPAASFAVMLPNNATREYSGAVAWTETGTTMPVTTFDGSKAYTATMTLTADPGYQFAAGTTFSVAGADSVATAIGDYGLTATVTANFAVKNRYKIDVDGVITAYSGPGGELVVPGTIDGTTVIGIKSEAFSSNDSLTKVTLPDTIKNFSENCFMSCTKLQTINIPKALTSIPLDCFNSCYNLETVTIPTEASVQTIGVNAFNFTKLKTIALSVTVISIGNYAFRGCNQLTTVTFTANSQLKTIGKDAFAGTGLTTLSLPKSLTSLGKEAFNQCVHLTTLNFESGSQLSTISEKAFCECSTLTALELPKSVMAIGNEAFARSPVLATLSFESGSLLSTIGDNAFGGCALTELNLPATVTAIGEGAFGVNKLTKLTLNNPVGTTLTIGSDAFMGNHEGPSQNPITEITLPTNVSIPDSTITGYATMGLYGVGFKNFYNSTEAGGNNSDGGIFVYNTEIGNWSKTN
ncbi:leucine-rich repeat protein [Acetobacterium paludosum]|uniref:leucine-rich repeat protein n=1 Tax=Acetobacterium paludosum TaxID=52693 RepID=UPI001FA9CF37|nr:leucine-rich repeat protein [Acetobacterium paludosum]